MASQKRKHDSTQRTELSSHINIRYLSDKEKTERIKRQKCELKRTCSMKNRVVKKLKEMNEEVGVYVQEDLDEDLHTIITDGSVASPQNDSFKQIFWEQQLKAAQLALSSKKKDCRSMRWHPLMIRWCLYLCHQSQNAYETAREILYLPSQRTLRDYTHYCKGDPGFSTAVDEQLICSSYLNSLEEWQKCVIILIDEMHVKKNLVYEKHSGNIRFTNLGDVNEELLCLEQECEHGGYKRSLAQSMVTFMVRGIFTSLKFPYAHFPCKNLTGDVLFNPFWEAVYRLERCGFKVSAHHSLYS